MLATGPCLRTTTVRSCPKRATSQPSTTGPAGSSVRRAASVASRSGTKTSSSSSGNCPSTPPMYSALFSPHSSFRSAMSSAVIMPGATTRPSFTFGVSWALICTVRYRCRREWCES